MYFTVPYRPFASLTVSESPLGIFKTLFSPIPSLLFQTSVTLNTCLTNVREKNTLNQSRLKFRGSQSSPTGGSDLHRGVLGVGVPIQSNGRLESTQGSLGGGLNPVQWEAWILHSGLKGCVRKKTIHRGGKDRLGSVASKAARNSSSEHLGFSPSSSVRGFYSSPCCGLALCLGSDTAAFSSDPMNERMAAEG